MWTAVYRTACEQGVELFLLATVRPALADKGALWETWRATLGAAVLEYEARTAQLSELIETLEAAQIPGVLLKGAWLSEKIYPEPIVRSMSDLDILIPAAQRQTCDAALVAIGYRRADTPSDTAAYDQGYHHARHPKKLELHWNFSSCFDEHMPPVALEPIWQRTRPRAYRAFEIPAFSVADQVAHLVHHTLHHQFAVPLRAYLDLALLLQKESPSAAELVEVARDWQVQKALPLLLGLVRDLFELELAPDLAQLAAPPEAARYRMLLQILATLPSATERGGESSMLALQRAGRLRRGWVILGRVFLPRQQLALHYPCARSRWGLPRAWWLRARDLYRRHGCRVHAALGKGAGTIPHSTALRHQLTRALLPDDAEERRA